MMAPKKTTNISKHKKLEWENKEVILSSDQNITLCLRLMRGFVYELMGFNYIHTSSDKNTY